MRVEESRWKEVKTANDSIEYSRNLARGRVLVRERNGRVGQGARPEVNSRDRSHVQAEHILFL